MTHTYLALVRIQHATEHESAYALDNATRQAVFSEFCRSFAAVEPLLQAVVGRHNFPRAWP